MEVIERNRQGNDGGLRQLYVAPAADYPAIIAAANHTANLPLGTIDTYFTRIKLVPESAYHSEELQEDPTQGEVFRQEVHFPLFRDSEDRAAFLKKWTRKPAIIYLIDANFCKKLIGSADEPLYLGAKYDSGKAVVELNAYIHQFAGITLNPALRADM